MEIEKSTIILYDREQEDNNCIISSFNGNKLANNSTTQK